MKPARALVIVCAYPDGRLPSGWFQAIQRTRRKIERAGVGVRLELLPVSHLPPDADVVVVSEAPRPTGQLGSEFVIAEPGTLAPTLDALLARLDAEGRIGPRLPASRAIAVHRGFLPLGERARIAD